MGGFILYVQDRDEAVDAVNMPCMGIFFEVLKQANLRNDWSNCVICCSKDDDLQCETRGPLCKGKSIGDLFLDFEKFLVLNQKAKEWLAGNSDFDSGYENNWSSRSTDHQVATSIVKSFISNLKKLTTKEKTLFYAEEASHNSAFPCERNLVMHIGKQTQCLELVDYDYAKEHRSELKDLNVKDWHKGSRKLTKKEAVEKGIVFAGTSDSKKQN